MPLSAMLLAAGEGQRLHPKTLLTPKPLLPIDGKSMLERWLHRLNHSGVKRVVVNTCYLKEQFPSAVRNMQTPIEVSLIEETVALDTAGGVRNAIECLSDPFLLISADIWVEASWEQLLSLQSEFEMSPYKVLLGLVKTKPGQQGDFNLKASLLSPSEVGISAEVVVDHDHHYEFQYAGIAWSRRSAFEYLDPGRAVGLGEVLAYWAKQRLVLGVILDSDQHWDMGTLQAFGELEAHFKQ